jgi:hypothetical protein
VKCGEELWSREGKRKKRERVNGRNICSREVPNGRFLGIFFFCCLFVGFCFVECEKKRREGGEGESRYEREALRDGEVLSLLGSDGKLLLVGGLAHVESMDVKE